MMGAIQGDDEAMRTTCPSCETAYTIPDDKIGAKGRKVRCTRCGEEWRVTATAEPPPVEPIEIDDLFASVSTDEPAPRAPAPEVSTRAPDPFDDLDASDVEPEPEPDAPPPTVDAVVEPPAVAVEAAPAAAAAAPTPPPRPAPRPPVARRRLFRADRWRLPMPRFVSRLSPFGGPALFLAACLACAGLFVFRATVVARVPALAGFYRMVGLEVNLRGIVFGPMETLRETEDGKPVLVVEGELTNTTGQSRDVPALRFALRDADAQELYAWSVDPRASVIAAGDRLRFRTRLVAPPDRAVDLQVRFAERRNRQAGLP